MDIFRNYSRLDDEELWKALKSGDRNAFDHIFQKHIKVLYSYGAKFTKDPQFVEDCIQDIFITLWIQREKLKDTNSIKYYLFKSLKRRIIRNLPQTSISLDDEKPFSTFPFSLSVTEPFDELQDEGEPVQLQMLQQGIEKLTDRQKEAIYLRYFALLTYEEVAQILGLTVKATYKLVARALTSLKIFFSI